MSKLDSYLEIEYKYVSTYKDSEPNIEGIKTVTYQFEDINGVTFYVVTFPRFGDYDSSQSGYPRCNYLTAYCEVKKESILKVLQCGNPITWNNKVFSIEMSSYDELEMIAPIIEEALNMFSPLISENYSGTALDKFEFYIPEISIWTSDKKRIISGFDFPLVKGQLRWTKDEILDKLHRDYIANITEYTPETP